MSMKILAVSYIGMERKQHMTSGVIDLAFTDGTPK
jgi:hypothetical protein